MIVNILPFLLIAIAAFFNSIMDTINHHYNSSIFSNMPKWWNNNWEEKRKLKGWREIFLEPFFDAWHTAKLLFLITCCVYPIYLLYLIYIQNYDFNSNPLYIHPFLLIPIGMFEWWWLWNIFSNAWIKSK